MSSDYRVNKYSDCALSKSRAEVQLFMPVQRTKGAVALLFASAGAVNYATSRLCMTRSVRHNVPSTRSRRASSRSLLKVVTFACNYQLREQNSTHNSLLISRSCNFSVRHRRPASCQYNSGDVQHGNGYIMHLFCVGLELQFQHLEQIHYCRADLIVSVFRCERAPNHVSQGHGYLNKQRVPQE